MHLIKLNFICPALGGGLQTGLFKFLFVRRVEYPRCLCRGGVLFTVCSFCIRRQLLQTRGTKDRPYLGGS